MLDKPEEAVVDTAEKKTVGPAKEKRTRIPPSIIPIIQPLFDQKAAAETQIKSSFAISAKTLGIEGPFEVDFAKMDFVESAEITKKLMPSAAKQ